MKKSDDTQNDDGLGSSPADPQRRILLGGLVLAGVSSTVTPATAAKPSTPKERPTPSNLDALLRDNIETIVVVYAENRSFNNLFANFPGLQAPLGDLDQPAYRQRDRDGAVLARLPPVWGGLAPKSQQVEHQTYQINQSDLPALPNRPFALTTPAGDPLPQGVVTRDLLHAFYPNQMQINGGRNDGFVAWGDSGALVMGHYADSSVNLRLWNLARRYTLCDNFFMGAFGGSFLNHQYLIAAQPPRYPQADRGPAQVQIARLEGTDPMGARLSVETDSPVSALEGPPRYGPSALTPDFWAVNTMGPPYAPGFSRDPDRPEWADPNQASTLPPQTHKTLGDRLSAKGIDWAWYAGGWGLAVSGTAGADAARFPARPNFQAHHQPFNYFQRFAPGKPDRQIHLRDAGSGDSSRTNRFLVDAREGSLPQVTFYKPQGDLNMHAGYSDIEAGDRHIARVVEALQQSPQWSKMIVIITFDENGGWWDHVPPPKGDRWGPGTRIPALVVSPHAKTGYVDHTIYDTGSIARLITRRFGLQKLVGLETRERAMIEHGGPPPGDLTAALF